MHRTSLVEGHVVDALDERRRVHQTCFDRISREIPVSLATGCALRQHKIVGLQAQGIELAARARSRGHGHAYETFFPPEGAVAVSGPTPWA